MSTTATTATAELDNGGDTETGTPSEQSDTTDTSTATDETDETDGSNVTDETNGDEAARLKFYQGKAREFEAELKKLRKAEEDRQRAELTELERLKADLEQRDTELATIRRDAMLARISAEHGLTAELAERLKGDTEDELAEDAKRLAELIGKRKPNTPPASDAGIGGKAGDDLPTDPVALARRFTAGR